MKRRDKIKNRRGWEHPAVASDRARWARERRTLVASLITQKGFEGAIVLEHIKGSQYLIRMPDGTEVYASHAKQREDNSSLSTAGWRLWDLGSVERG